MLTAIVTHINGRAVHVRLVQAENTDTTIANETATSEAPPLDEAAPTSETSLGDGLATTTYAGETVAVVKSAPNPIAPELKELAWGAGSFVVLFVLMRYFLFPKLKKGMDARYADIRSDIDGAVQEKASAQSDVAEYEKALASARAEAASRLDVARQTVDTERTAQLTQVNARIATARASSEQATAAARAAAQGEVAQAVSQIARRAGELVTGRIPDDSVVQAAVAAAMESSGSR